MHLIYAFLLDWREPVWNRKTKAQVKLYWACSSVIAILSIGKCSWLLQSILQLIKKEHKRIHSYKKEWYTKGKYWHLAVHLQRNKRKIQLELIWNICIRNGSELQTHIPIFPELKVHLYMYTVWTWTHIQMELFINTLILPKHKRQLAVLPRAH